MNRHVTVALAALAAPAVVLSGCANESSDTGATPTTSTEAGGQALTTELKTVDGTTVADATIDFSDGYATVTVETTGPGALSPGFHGLHLHAFGRCEPNSTAPSGGPAGDFNSAGDHLQAPGQTSMPASGDLPPLLVRSDGSGRLVTTSDAFTEEQLTDPDGSSIILHEGADMPGATEGADVRLACGVISPATASTSVSTSTSTSVVTTTVAPPPPATVTETTAPPATTTTVSPATETSTVTETTVTTTVTTSAVPSPTSPAPGPNG